MFKDTSNGCLIQIKVRTDRPRARLVEISDSFVLVELKSKPVENKANLELISFLKKILKTEVEIVGGHKSKLKKIFVYGIDASECASRLLESLDN